MINSFQKHQRAEALSADIEVFKQVKKDQFVPFRRRIEFLSDTAGALGLLGTVWGIYVVFSSGITDKQLILKGMGLALASGMTVEEAQVEIQQVVEGVLAAKAVREVAGELGVEMPICEEIYRILYEGVPPADAVRALMSRALGAE